MASTEHVPSFAHLEFDTPLYRTAIAQFDQAVPHANVDPANPSQDFLGLMTGAIRCFPNRTPAA